MQRRVATKFIGLLLFVVLPQSLWLVAWAGPAIASITPWREVIVFLVPVVWLITFRIKLALRLLVLLLTLICLMGLSLFHTFSASSISAGMMMVGLLPYLATATMMVFFFSLTKPELASLLRPLYLGLGVGGLGLILDLATGYAIAERLESYGIERTTSGLVPRAGFLFAGEAHAALVLSFMLFVAVLGRWWLTGTETVSGKMGLKETMALIMAVCGVIVTFSRIGLVALAILAMLTVVYRRNFRALLVGCAVVLASILLLGVVFEDEARVYFGLRAASLVMADSEEELDLGRTEQWKEGIENLRENIVMGSGIGSGNPRNNRGEGLVSHYESFPLWVINEAGLFGFLLMFLPYLLMIKGAFRVGLGALQRLVVLGFILAVYGMISVNPGGGNYEVIVLACMTAAVFWSSAPSHSPRLAAGSTGGAHKHLPRLAKEPGPDRSSEAFHELR